MGKLFKRIFDVIFILIIIVLVGYFVFRSMGILEIYEVETGSMEHGIHVGDYVLICRKKTVFRTEATIILVSFSAVITG